MFSLISSLFGARKHNKNSEVYKAAFRAGEDSAHECRFKVRKSIAISEIDCMVNKPFFSISNEWEDPVFGIVLGVRCGEKDASPHAIIWDYVKNEESLCYNKLRRYSKENFDALYKLNPYQRWNLMSNTVGHSTVAPEEFPKLLTKVQMFRLLTKNGFFKQIETKQSGLDIHK